MATVNVSELITRAQQAADMEDDFISQSTWLYWANVEYKKLWTRVARMGYPVQYIEESVSWTGALQYTITEPTAVIGVFGLTTTGRRYRIPVKHPADAKYSGSVRQGNPSECYIQSEALNNQIIIKFWPVPQTGSCLVGVIERPKKLVLSSPGADESITLNFPMGWEERIVLGMARRALGKEETTNPAIEREISEMDNTIENHCSSYLLSEQPTVRDMNEIEAGTLVYPGEWFFI